MRSIILSLISLATVCSAGPADTFSIAERAAATTTNYPVQIGRPIADLEIQHYPQVGICTDSTCATVSSWLTTQADVKQRYASGYVKHAILSFYIPTLSANATVYFAVRDQAGCNCGTGLTQAQMLDPSYDFDAVMALSNGITASISAAAILTAWDGVTVGQTGPVYYWTAGTVATSIIIADHRNLNTCNSHACSSNDVGSDTNDSFRPEFHATFWPLTHQVSVRFVGEVLNSEAMQNQTEDISLSVGSASPRTVYTQTAVTTFMGSRWMIRRNNQSGQTWTVSTPSGSISVQKEIWIGGVPGQISINHNLGYLAAAKAIPNYDPTWVMTETGASGLSSNWTAFAAADVTIGGNGGSGIWGSKKMDDTGASPWIGPLSRWDSQWVEGFDVRSQEIALRADDLGSSFQNHIIEGKAGENLLRTDTPGAGTGVGHILSISTRPYFLGQQVSNWTYAGTQGRPQDNVNPIGTNTPSVWDVHSMEHLPDRGSAEYLLTGDYWYLQEQWFIASYAASASNGAAKTSASGRGPTGAEGGVVDNSDPRGAGWGERAVVMAAYITPDTLPEEAYFSQLIADFLSIEEGARCGAGDVLSWCASSPRHGNATWVWGYTYRAQTNPAGLGYPPLGQFYAGSNSFVQGSPLGSPGGTGYGINLVAGTGTLSNSGASSTVTLSDGGACSALPVNATIYACSNSTYTSGNIFNVNSVSCPNVTLSASIDASACSFWYYSPNVHFATSQFSNAYITYVYGRSVSLGYNFSNLLNIIEGYFTGLITDSSSNPRLAFSGRTPTINTSLAYFPTYAALKLGWTTDWQTYSSGYSPNGGNAPPEGYPAYLQAAVSFAPATGLSNGTAAWNWVATNVSTDTGYTNDPTWALLPASAQNAPSSVITGSTLFAGKVVIQ